MQELYHKYRPNKFKDVVGQHEAVTTLSSFLKNEKLPKVILLTGPSGTGKNTLSYILKGKLDCGDIDFYELNCAKERGIDMVRDISTKINMFPRAGSCVIWYLDEAHKMTSDAQTALLKILEFPPEHAYFILTTTDPQKLLKTVTTRCEPIKTKLLSEKDLTQLLSDILTKEGAEISDGVKEKIIEAAEGSARMALVLLNKVINLENDDDRMEAIHPPEIEKKGIDIARKLMDPKSDWKQIAKLILELKGEPVETIRHIILGYANSALLKGWGPSSRAFLIIEVFKYNWYDCGECGLSSSCYRIFLDKKS